MSNQKQHDQSLKYDYPFQFYFSVPSLFSYREEEEKIDYFSSFLSYSMLEQ